MAPFEGKPKIGVMVRNPVRAEGLSAVFADIAVLHSVTPAEAMRDVDLSILMVDADESIFNLLAAYRRARAGLRLLVFGEDSDPRYISRIVAAGAKAYLTHLASADEIRMAVSVVLDGSIWAPRKVLAELIDTYSPDEPRRVQVHFSERERQILALLVSGQSDREIALDLRISPRTVQSAVSRMLHKAGVSNRVALTVKTLELRLLHAH